MSGDLTEFLLARVAEDEAEAQAATHATHGQWVAPDAAFAVGRVELARPWPEGSTSVFDWTVVFDEGSPSSEQAAHIARHDPARVLAECEAKRRIVERATHTYVPDDDEWDLGRASGEEEMGDEVLRMLAQPYADHPDFDPAWLV